MGEMLKCPKCVRCPIRRKPRPGVSTAEAKQASSQRADHWSKIPRLQVTSRFSLYLFFFSFLFFPTTIRVRPLQRVTPPGHGPSAVLGTRYSTALLLTLRPPKKINSLRRGIILFSKELKDLKTLRKSSWEKENRGHCRTSTLRATSECSSGAFFRTTLGPGALGRANTMSTKICGVSV